MGDTSKAVTFLTPDGNEVSNDPRFYEDKMFEQIDAANRKMLMNELENTGKPFPEGTGDEDANTGAAKALEDMTGDELKAEVDRLKTQGVEVDTTGVKRKSDLIERIQEAMEAQDDEDVEDDNPDPDDNNA